MRIENYRESNQNDKFLAIFDVYLEKHQLLLRNLKLAVSKKGNHYFQWPSFSIEESNGEKKFLPFYEFSPEKKSEFETMLQQEIIPLLKGPWLRGNANR